MRERLSVTARKLLAVIGAWLGVATLAFAQSGLREGVPTVETIAPPEPSVSADGSGLRADYSDSQLTPETYFGDHLPFDDSQEYSQDHIFDLTAPALTESSGTWLRRGWWYTRMEALAQVRRWDRDSRVFAVDPTRTILLGGDDVALLGASPTLRLARSSPGREGSYRLTLGRFLFRDTDNRDHTAEFTYYGGGDFLQSEAITSTTANGLLTNLPFATFISGAVVVPVDDTETALSFDGARASQIEYSSRFNSFEWNYVVTSRPGRDRMELQPDGEWVRRQNRSRTYHGVFGLRYLNLEENLDWTATGAAGDFANVIDPNTTSGRYDIDTHNNLFGPQFGGGLTQEWDRMSLTIGGKMGVLANYIDTRERLSFSDGMNDTAEGFSQTDQENTLPFLLEFGITGRWHLRPNVSIRAGYDMLFITALALAPQQVNFEEFDDDISHAADSFYHGISLGIEGFW